MSTRQKKTTKKNSQTAGDGAGYDLALAAAVHALSPLAPRKKTSKKNRQSADNDDISTDFALGCDGHVYVSSELFSEEGRKGRKRFVGYRLTPREQAAAVSEAHAIAFNLWGPIAAAMRKERELKRKRAAKAAPAT